MRTLPMKKKVVGILAAGLMIATAGGAYAYWTTTGSGSGSAATSSGSANLLHVNETSAISNMYPGDSAQSITATVNNTSTTQSAYVHQVIVTISSVAKATGAVAGTCDDTDYTLANPTMTITGVDLVQSTTSGTFSGATLKFNNKATNQDPCKGATVNLSYSAS